MRIGHLVHHLCDESAGVLVLRNGKDGAMRRGVGDGGFTSEWTVKVAHHKGQGAFGKGRKGAVMQNGGSQPRKALHLRVGKAGKVARIGHDGGISNENAANVRPVFVKGAI